MGVLKGQQAQTAIEIAVFGAILIFALGAIVRSGVGRGNQQNSVYKATRLALRMSYDTSASMTNSSRNSASVLIIEDRLTAGSGKYGPINRAPFLVSGSGTHSANIFMPVDFRDAADLPLFDLFVNGKQIALSTSAFKTINLFPGGGCGGQCSSQVWISSTTSRQVCSPCPEIEPNCAGQATIGPCANDPSLCISGVCLDCSATSIETYTISSSVSACAKLYSIIDHHPKITEWCDESVSFPCPVACSTSAVPGCNLSAAERFDLDRNDLDGIPGDALVPPGEWERFSWQWFLVMGYTGADSVPPASNLTSLPGGPVSSSGLLMGEGIRGDVDVDQDLKIERVYAEYASNGIITSLDVLDYQDGDIDFSVDDRYTGIRPGFTKDVNVYTKVYDGGAGGGTYLRIDEGKLFSGEQYIRTASKKDVVDIVERFFKLSNDTGRLCLGGVPQQAAIEACGNCFSPENIARTCMDPNSLFIFFRSRISDYHGHKWVTEEGNDPYIDF